MVGGGATGVEYFGELTDFLRDVTSKERKGAYASLFLFTKITLIHGGDESLPQFDKPLRTQAMESLKDRGIIIKLNTRVAQVESPTLVKIFKKDLSPELLDEINCGIIAWAAGTAPVPLTELLLEKLPMKSPIQGSYHCIPVNPWLRVIGYQPRMLFALGDAAVIVSQDDSQVEQNYILPQTARVTAQ